MWKPRERILHFVGLWIVVELRWALEMIRTLVHLITVYWVSTRRRQWQPTAVLLPGKSHGSRSLVGCSPRGRYQPYTTERLHFHFSLSCIGEGNGSLLQCSCLENPRDGGAWWAAVYGIAQSRKWLKWLSIACLFSLLYLRSVLRKQPTRAGKQLITDFVIGSLLMGSRLIPCGVGIVKHLL